MKRFPRLTPAEFEIMDVIWNGDQMTVTEVMKLVNSNSRREFSRSTIQVQIQRLAEKGWLNQHRQASTFLYSASVPRSEATASIAEDMKERVFGGSCVDLVRSPLGPSDVTSRELEELKKIIKRHEQELKKK